MDEAKFRITGTVSRVYVNQAGSFASLSLEVAGEGGKRAFIDLKAFREAVDMVGATQKGMRVTVTGRVGSEKLTSKDKQPVKVDGFDRWVPALMVEGIVTAGVAAKPKPKAKPIERPPVEPFDSSDDVPF